MFINEEKLSDGVSVATVSGTDKVAIINFTTSGIYKDIIGLDPSEWEALVAYVARLRNGRLIPS